MISIAGEREIDKLKKLLKTKNRRLLFYHRDSDGVCSAAQMLKFFPDFETYPLESPRMEEGFIESVIEKEPSLVVFVDLPVGQEAEKVERLSKECGCFIIIIDHHIPQKDMNSDSILHINHMFENDIYIPTSYQVQWLLEKIGKKASMWDWISAIGIIGDYGFRECKDFLNKVKAKYPDLLSDNALESKLGLGSNVISSAITMKGVWGAERALKTLVEAKKFEDFFEDEELGKLTEEMKLEIDRLLEDFPKKKEEFANINLILYEIKSKLNITSVIASKLARLYPEDIIVVRKHTEKGVKMSLRCQRGQVNLGLAVKACIEGIGSGGGHPKAAGAFVTDWKRFKDRFIEKVSELQMHDQARTDQAQPYLVSRNGKKE